MPPARMAANNAGVAGTVVAGEALGVDEVVVTDGATGCVVEVTEPTGRGWVVVEELGAVVTVELPSPFD